MHTQNSCANEKEVNSMKNNIGGWNIDVTVNKLPQKVATAMGKLEETLIGAEYEPIAYLGSQVTNGVNHAVLAEQIVTTGRDTNNIVVLIFNEKPGEMELSLVGIERVVESGAAFGGTTIDVKTDLDDEIMDIWDEAFEGYVGAKVVPFALLGTQVVKGVNYIFAAEFTPMTLSGEKEAKLVVVNNVTRRVAFADMMANKHETSLGYAFTW